MSAQVALREFRAEIEAELAAATLRANGIPSEVKTDRAGIVALYGAGPWIVMVQAKDAELARRLLDTPAEPDA